MKPFPLKFLAAAVAVLSLSGSGRTLGGQAMVAPLKDFLDGAQLVAVVEVRKVTEVEVSTGENQVSMVYVAEAEIVETLKTDHWPAPEKRKIAIVGSTIPRSSAVWRPIEKGRYLAFLKGEQGHYHYGARYALRAVNDQGKVAWIEKKGTGVFDVFDLDLAEAVKRIRKELESD